MNSFLIRSENAITLIGGGDVGPMDLDLALRLAPVLVAVDSGAGVALAAGHMPDAVIGDFDSIAEADKARVPSGRLHHIKEQDSTDFDKALSRVETPLVLAVGFLGDRVDHQLAALNCLVRRSGQPCILLGRHEVIFHLPPCVELALEPGDVVSLFPLAKVAGRSQGLEWPIDGLTLSPNGQIGTSNRALGPVRLETDGAGLIALVPRTRLEIVAAAIRFRADAG